MTSIPKQEKKKETFFNQLMLLTGEVDKSLLQKAYVSCNGEISSAIHYVETYKKEFEESTTMPDLTGRSLSYQKASALPLIPGDNRDTMTGISAPAPSYVLTPHRPSALDVADPVIDLTDEDAELQQAIKLSMEYNVAQPAAERGNFTDTNSQDPSSNSAASSAADKTMKPASNPYLRHRMTGWPAGLKNIGNTCWFSSVVQSLFHLPVFRNLVLQYQPPSELPSVDSERYRNIRFMQEMKSLFALLVGTNQSYVDPTKCVTQLLTAFVRDQKNQQQDVSEFTHKLLDWLEDAMAHRAVPLAASVEGNEGDEPSSPMDVDQSDQTSTESEPLSNPVVDLFYGEYKAEGMNNGNSFTKPQKFGIFPLYVNRIDNLHDSLDYTTRDRSSIEDTAETKDVVGQEHWFTKLPPVLIFELSRFHYNQKSEAPEKIHSRFDFPHLLYMDRYMETNAERIRQCRGDSDDLARQLYALKEELRKKRKIMVGEKSCLIQDVLKCCTEIAASKRKRYLQCKRSHPSSKRTRNSLGDHTLHDRGAGDGQVEDNTEKKIEDASVVEECLKNWLEEFEREKEALRDDINDIQKRLDSMYDDPALKQHPYDLHAVLIHQGYAVAGHYWAYVKDHKKPCWLRYNDTDVRETDWDELIAESIGGGQGLTSAYCLMYIDRRKRDSLMAEGIGKVDSLFSDEELKAIVYKHNADFSAEIEEWDLEQAKKLSLSMQEDAERKNSTDLDRKSRKESEESETGYRSSSSTEGKKKNEALSSWNAEASMKAIANAHRLYDALGAEETLDHDLTLQASMLAIASAGETFNMKGPDAALLEVLYEEFDRLRKLERESSSTSDVRLHHIAVFMFRNKAPRKIIERTLLEQFSDDRMTYDHRATEIMNCAKDKLKTIPPEELNEEIYQKWHRDYRLFCQATCHLLQGLEFWSKGRYTEALPHLANVKRKNDMLFETATEKSSSRLLADWDLGLKTVEQCLKSLNMEALNKVKEDTEDSINDGIALLIDDIVPWIHLLPMEESGVEMPLVKMICNDWCNLAIPRGTLRDRYERALAALIDPPTTFRPPAITKPQNAQDLCDRFQRVMSMITLKG